ncbi:hypothetical protein J3R30DRAFT_129906 [Lentinula aciculospora]|uniref:Uncharacterized protein n=1 Tax=Lentinula aciculospora TaxID=153920 RepID=A0A9W9AUB4_9AGAR|nr:hypothetical protein J3R30DRAFT_129906 [Lentinula aciculospora]
MAAPTISSEALISTPAHEWASETLNSVPNETGSTTVSPSTATTPGFDFPGAYPRTPSTKVPLGNAVSEIADRAKDATTVAATSVGEVVNGLPDVRTIGGGLDGVKEALYNATVSASQYLPSNVIEYFPGGSAIVAASAAERDAQGISLPSTEHSVDPAPSQGVGSLPGPASEEGVAKLPLERDSDPQDLVKVQQEDYGTSESLTNASMVAQYGSSGPTPTMEKASVQDEGIPSHFKEDLDQKVPDTKTSSTAFDADIPVLDIPPITTIPDIPNIAPPQAPRSSQNDSTIANVGHDKLSSEFEMIPSTPSLTSNANTATTGTDLAEPHSHSPVTSVSNTRHANHTKDVSVSSALSEASTGSRYGSGVDGAAHDRDGSVSHSANSTPSGTPSKKKATLMSKIKGEAKIISGKLGGKEDKVEEGRRLIRGDL